MIDHCIHKYGDTSKDKHTITFADLDFPGAQAKLKKTKAEHAGAWYQMSTEGALLEGWLCPAPHHYFESMPEEIYVAFDL